MLDSKSAMANAHNFMVDMCHQLTWAIINDSRQFFFTAIIAHQFASGRIQWPTLLLMQMIRMDVHACQEIKMGNFPTKWMMAATDATKSTTISAATVRNTTNNMGATAGTYFITTHQASRVIARHMTCIHPTNGYPPAC